MHRLGRWWWLACAALFLSFSAQAAPTGSMSVARMLHAAATLPDGRVLITGGIGAAPTFTALDSAELYDPQAGSFTPLSARMTTPRNQHTATALPDGRVLIAGGSNDIEGDGMDSAELYDPATQSFTALAARMKSPRGGHTATALANGRVLLTGGFFDSSDGLASAEIYDPARRTFRLVAATMAQRREGHAAARLRDGRVLLTGGTSAHVALDSAEIFDPQAVSFTPLAARMTTARSLHSATALPNGPVVLAGGTPGSTSTADFVAFDGAEVFNPASGRFAPLAATLATARAGHTATLLPSGVLFTGGGTGDHTPVIVLDGAEIASRAGRAQR